MIEIADAVRRCRSRRSTAKVSVPRAASSPSTVRRGLAAADRAAHGLERALERSSSPGPTMRLKRTSSMPAKSASRPRFSSSESTATAPACAMRLDHHHAGHDRPAGEMARAVPLVGRTVLRATTRSPGSSSSTSSSRRNGSRCGRIASISCPAEQWRHAVMPRRRSRAAARRPSRARGVRSTSRCRRACPSPRRDLREREVERVLRGRPRSPAPARDPRGPRRARAEAPRGRPPGPDRPSRRDALVLEQRLAAAHALTLRRRRGRC